MVTMFSGLDGLVKRIHLRSVWWNAGNAGAIPMVKLDISPVGWWLPHLFFVKTDETSLDPPICSACRFISYIFFRIWVCNQPVNGLYYHNPPIWDALYTFIPPMPDRIGDVSMFHVDLLKGLPCRFPLDSRISRKWLVKWGWVKTYSCHMTGGLFASINPDMLALPHQVPGVLPAGARTGPISEDCLVFMAATITCSKKRNLPTGPLGLSHNWIQVGDAVYDGIPQLYRQFHLL